MDLFISGVGHEGLILVFRLNNRVSDSKQLQITWKQNCGHFVLPANVVKLRKRLGLEVKYPNHIIYFLSFFRGFLNISLLKPFDCRNTALISTIESSNPSFAATAENNFSISQGSGYRWYRKWISTDWLVHYLWCPWLWVSQTVLLFLAWNL